jgi:hypothetical protein
VGVNKKGEGTLYVSDLGNVYEEMEFSTFVRAMKKTGYIPKEYSNEKAVLFMLYKSLYAVKQDGRIRDLFEKYASSV